MNYQPWFLIKIESQFHTFYHITIPWADIWKFGHPGGAEEEHSFISVDTWGQIQVASALKNAISGVFVGGKPVKDCALVQAKAGQSSNCTLCVCSM